MNRTKWSQSLSSLESSHRHSMRAGAAPPEGLLRKLSPLNRLSSNSLNSMKSRRTPERKMWKRSCGSEAGSQEELWKMSILACQGSPGFRTSESEAKIDDFLKEYSRISDWLNQIQLARGKCANTASLRKLADELRINKPLMLEFIVKAKNFAKEFPSSKEEFVWRAKHLASQWNALEKLLQCHCAPKTSQVPQPNDGTEVRNVTWLKTWLREIEDNLQPLTFNLNWTDAQIQDALERHKALQAEIDEQAPSVHTILKQYQTQELTSGSSRSCIQKQNKRAENLEGRWIQLRLRVLEWVEHLSSLETKGIKEEQANRQPVTATSTNWNEFPDDNIEPARKYPRLGDSHASSTVEVVRNSNNFQTTAYFGVGFYPTHLDFDIGKDPHEELFDDSDWIMGQSQETESAYQSLSPVPNSVIEFTFDGSESIGMKRKLNSASLPSQNIFFQVVPSANKNVSTFYFKHNSDTEPELVQRVSHDADGHGHENEQNTSVSKYDEISETNGTSIEDFCQDDLEFGQEDLDNMNFTDTNGHIPETETSVELEVMDAKSLQNLNEIEELVQKVESLIKSSRCCAHQADDRCWKENGFQDEETEAGTSASSYKGERLPATCHAVRKSYGAGASSFGSKCRGAKLKAKNMIDKSRTISSPKKGGPGNSCDGDLVHAAKLSKKHARVRQWIRAHNSKTAEHIPGQKNSSSCDASAESASETESESELQLSSDDPTTVCASIVQHCQVVPAYSPKARLYVKKAGSSSTTVNKLSPSVSTSGGVLGAGGVIWRSKKKNSFQQRPKSFTDATAPSQCFFTASNNPDYFVSDTALNFLGRPSRSGSSSGGEPSQGQSTSETFKEGGKRRQARRKLFRSKRRSLDCEIDENVGTNERLDGMLRSTSFTGVLPLDQDKENEVPDIRNPLVFHLNSDNASINTEEVPSNNDQDWDSYQEKYLSEPYSEELYDQDRTLKLLAFGEDYDQVLDRPDSESSSIFCGIESNSRKYPLGVKNQGEVQDSDSDAEEFRHFLSQSMSQLHYLDVIFRKYLAALGNKGFCPAEFAEMEATCEENMNSLSLILSNVEYAKTLAKDVDKQTIEGVLEQWKLLKEKIEQANKLQDIQEEANLLRGEFDNLSFSLGQVDPFDVNDLRTLVHKISIIQEMLVDLGGKKERVQALNEASVGSQLFLKESFVSEHIKRQMQELYALYEENYQLGSYLLSKMKYLQEAWEVFEMERNEFEKCLASNDDMHHKLKKNLSSAASTDSGHGTDFSHDSSVSDSDAEFKEKKQKLVALKKRASDLRTFIPPGSPVLDVIDKKINDAQRDFEILRKLGHFEPVDLKIIYPKNRSPSTNRKSPARSRKPSPSPGPTIHSRSSSVPPPSKKPNRSWKLLRLSLTFHLALMGLFAMAWLLQPRCCENTNTFCFNLVPHLSHEKMPHM